MGPQCPKGSLVPQGVHSAPRGPWCPKESLVPRGVLSAPRGPQCPKRFGFGAAVSTQWGSRERGLPFGFPLVPFAFSAFLVSSPCDHGACVCAALAWLLCLDCVCDTRCLRNQSY